MRFLSPAIATLYCLNATLCLGSINRSRETSMPFFSSLSWRDPKAIAAWSTAVSERLSCNTRDSQNLELKNPGSSRAVLLQKNSKPLNSKDFSSVNSEGGCRKTRALRDDGSDTVVVVVAVFSLNQSHDLPVDVHLWQAGFCSSHFTFRILNGLS